MRRLLLTACVALCVGAEEPRLIKQLLTNKFEKGIQMFTGEIAVGTPPQQMSAVFDTSIGLSYVYSKQCSDGTCTKHRQYEADKSSSYVADNTEFELLYGRNVSGHLSTDALTAAGVTVAAQTFGEVTSAYNKWFELMPNDAAVGLGKTEAQGTVPLLDTLAAQGAIERRMFGIWLGRNPRGGELALGGVNKDLFSGEMSWVNVSMPEAGWTVAPEKIALDGLPDLALCPGDSCTMMLTSNSPYFMLSPGQAEAINAALGAKKAQYGAYTLDCTALCDLPDLTIQLGGRTLRMTPQDYTLVASFEGGTQLCLSGFLSLPLINDQFWVGGTLLMQKYYTGYDAETGRVGFADAV